MYYILALSGHNIKSILCSLIILEVFHRLFEQFLVIIFSQVTDFRKNAQFLYFVSIFIK